MSEPSDILRRLMKLLKDEMTMADEASARQVNARVTSIGNTLNETMTSVQNALNAHISQDINAAHAGPISDATHGNRGGGSLHAVATNSVAGFLSSADKAKLDAYPATTGLTPTHVLAVQGDGSLAFSAMPSDGASVQDALNAHISQDINAAHAGPISDATHGNRGGGSLHAVATNSVAGFLSSADKAKLDAYPATTGLTPTHVLAVQGDGSLAFSAMPSHSHAHNDATGLQGGAPGEYYHLTQAQHAGAASIAGLPPGRVAITNNGALTTDADLTYDGVNNVLTGVNAAMSGYVELSEIAEPAAPAAGRGRLYAATSSLPYYRSDAYGSMPLGKLKARVRRTANFTVFNRTGTSIPFTEARQDTGGFWSSSTSGSPPINARLTIPVAGWYLVGFGVRFGGNTNGYRQAGIFLNNTTWLSRQMLFPVNDLVYMNGSTAYLFAAGDYVTCHVYVDTIHGDPVFIQAEASWSPEMWIVGPL